MNPKEKGGETWVAGLAVVITACFVPAVCSLAHAFPYGVDTGFGYTEGFKSDGRVAAMKDPLVYNVAELGLGAEPEKHVGHDERAALGTFGICHIGIGSE